MNEEALSSVSFSMRRSSKFSLKWDLAAGRCVVNGSPWSVSMVIVSPADSFADPSIVMKKENLHNCQKQAFYVSALDIEGPSSVKYNRCTALLVP